MNASFHNSQEDTILSSHRAHHTQVQGQGVKGRRGFHDLKVKYALGSSASSSMVWKESSHSRSVVEIGMFNSRGGGKE